MVPLLCDPAARVPYGARPLAELVKRSEWVRESLSVEKARACAEPLAREVLREVLGEKASGAEVEAAFASSREEKEVLGTFVDAGSPEHRLVLLRGVLADALSHDVLLRIRAAKRPLSAEEVELLAQVLLENRAGILKRHSCSGVLMELLASSPPSSREAARKRLRAALSELSDSDDRAMPRVGLVLLGEREFALPASREISEPLYLNQPNTNFESCLAVGLIAAGCSEEELLEAVHREPRPAETDRGPLCTRAASVSGASPP